VKCKNVKKTKKKKEKEKETYIKKRKNLRSKKPPKDYN
jgi:hypothetical protein